MPPTTRFTCRCIGGSARCWAGPGCSTPATARWRPWRPGPRSPSAGDFYLTRLPLTGEVAAQFAAWVEAALTGEAAGKLIEIRVEDELLGAGYEFERSQTAMVGQTEHTWSERVQIIRSEASGPEPSRGPGPPAGESRGGPARLDAAAGAGPDPVHDRLGVGAGRRRGPDRA